MADELPSGDRAVYTYFEFIALGFALEAVAAFVRGEQWHIWAGSIVLSAMFLLAGIKWPWIKGKFVSVDWALWDKRINRALRVVLVLTFITVLATGYYAYRKASRAWSQISREFSGLSRNIHTAPKEQAPKSQNAPAAPPLRPAKQPTKFQNEAREGIVLAKPIILTRGTLDALDAQIITSTAQRVAAEIFSCLAAPPNSFRDCVASNSTDVTEVRDNLHDHGIEFTELNASVKQLESSPSDGGLKHAALVLRAVADQLMVMSQAPSQSGESPNEHEHKPLPEKATLVLPDVVGLTPYGFTYYSLMAGRTATDIRICLVDQQKMYHKNKTDAATLCNSQYASSVSTIVIGLRDAHVTISSLQDAVKRMEAGADFDELQYIADLMDLLSQELGKRRTQ